MVGLFMSENTKFSSRLGGKLPPIEQVRIGTVVECNTASFTVDVMIAGSEFYPSVPICSLYGGWQARDITKLNKLRGAKVILLYIDIQYYVIGTVPVETKDVEKNVVNPLLDSDFGGSTALTYEKTIHRNYQGGRSNDIFDGDKVLATGEDTLLGLFQGGIALLKASPLAQIILGKYKDFIRMVGRRFQIYSDFGEMYLEHTNAGRVRASLHGGADLATESHPTVAKWTVQAWVGDDPANPDNRLHIRVNDVENSNFVTLEFDINGDMFLETSNDRNAKHGHDEKIDVINDRKITVGNDLTRSVTNNETNTVGNDYSQSVSNNSTCSSGNNKTEDVGNTLTITAGTAVIINAPSVSIN